VKELAFRLLISFCSLLVCGPLFQSIYSQDNAVTSKQPPGRVLQKPSAQIEPSLAPPIGPDTLSIPEDKIGFHGNWLKKKDWLLRANQISREIRDLSVEIQGLKASFGEKYNVIDDELDDFYKQLGLEQGKVQEFFASLEKYLQKRKQKELDKLGSKEDLGKMERSKLRDYTVSVELLEEEIKKHKTELSQLKLDMSSIEELDKSLTDRLKKLDEQVASAVEESSKTKDLVKEMWQMVDDKKARERYYMIRGDILEKLKSSQNYLKNDLMQNFESVVSTIKKQIALSKESIERLENQGLILKDRAKKVEEIKLVELEKAAKAKQKEDEEEETRIQNELLRKKIKKKPVSWSAKSYDFWTSFVAWIVSPFTSIYHSFFGAKSKVLTKKKLAAGKVVGDKPDNQTAPIIDKIIAGKELEAAKVPETTGNASTVTTTRP
jgi:hypothetical protein